MLANYTCSYNATGDRTSSNENSNTLLTTVASAGRVLTTVKESKFCTFSYDLNGNLSSKVGWVVSQNENTSMTYDYENRLHVHTDHLVSKKVTYTYSGHGLKRSEITGSGTTTLVWDGSEYLQGRD